MFKVKVRELTGKVRYTQLATDDAPRFPNFFFDFDFDFLIRGLICVCLERNKRVCACGACVSDVWMCNVGVVDPREYLGNPGGRGKGTWRVSPARLVDRWVFRFEDNFSGVGWV